LLTYYFELVGYSQCQSYAYIRHACDAVQRDVMALSGDLIVAATANYNRQCVELKRATLKPFMMIKITMIIIMKTRNEQRVSEKATKYQCKKLYGCGMSL